MVYAMYRSEGLAEVRQHGLLQGKRRSPGPAVAQGGGDEVDNSWTVCGRHTAVRRHCADRCSAMLSVCVDVFLMVSQGWVDASCNVTHRVYCHVSCTVGGMCSSNIRSSSSSRKSMKIHGSHACGKCSENPVGLGPCGVSVQAHIGPPRPHRGLTSVPLCDSDANSTGPGGVSAQAPAICRHLPPAVALPGVRPDKHRR